MNKIVYKSPPKTSLFFIIVISVILLSLAHYIFSNKNSDLILEQYFSNTSYKNIPLKQHTIGHLSIATGEIVIIDPLVDIDFGTTALSQKVPLGDYPVTLSILIDNLMGIRFAAAKITFSKRPTIHIEQAKSIEGKAYWVNVDTGLAGIFDLKAFEAMVKFNKMNTHLKEYYNLYDDFFEELLAQSYLKEPTYQRKSGDYLNLKVPNTDLYAPIFATGFGDGSYPVYLGFDSSDNLSAIYIHFIDIDEAYSDN